MEPSKKNPEIESFLNKLSGRSDSIRKEVCVNPPYGCGKPIKGFRNAKSLAEYKISGLCQICQDSIWTPD